LKGHVIYNNVHIFVESVLQGYHKHKDNWPEGSNFASASARGQRCFKINFFAAEFTPQVSLFMHIQTFYPEVESFTKNGD